MAVVSFAENMTACEEDLQAVLIWGIRPMTKYPDFDKFHYSGL